MSKIYAALEREQERQKQLPNTALFEEQSTTTEIEKRRVNHPQVLHKTSPEVVEEYINLYYTVNTLLGQRSGKVIQFIGSESGEGTSTLIEEFGRVSTDVLGKSVLVLRAQSSGQMEHVPSETPNTQHLESLNDRLSEEVNHGAPCFVVWALSYPVSSDSVRSSDRFQSVLLSLREQFDLILIDMPSLSRSPLGLAMCGFTDGVILVLEADKSTTHHANKAKQRIQRAGGNLLGAVLNKHKPHIPQRICNQL